MPAQTTEMAQQIQLVITREAKKVTKKNQIRGFRGFLEK